MPPFPVELVPLFPEFLTKRRTKFTLPLRLMEELGIDRPALFFAIGGVAPQGGGRFSEMWNPYATQWDQQRAASAAARDAGLVDEKDGRWDLTPAGRDLTSRVRREADAYLASLPSPLSTDDLARLASLLGRAFEATAASLDRRWHSHIPRAARMAGDGRHPMVGLENAVYGLWQARDDCHMAAWRQAGLDGPTLDTLTRIWRGEAASEEDLAAKLTSQRPADVTGQLRRLRRDGLIADGPPRTTDKGAKERQAIEDETDRLFFSGWPDDVGASAGWIREKLAAVNASF
ncbi:MAG: helix-turn-helix domain-containing protein [Candidatus Limnocylindria bacterium]